MLRKSTIKLRNFAQLSQILKLPPRLGLGDSAINSTVDNPPKRKDRCIIHLIEQLIPLDHFSESYLGGRCAVPRSSLRRSSAQDLEK